MIIYRTDNTEYFTTQGECVGVRDGRTGKWIRGHRAIGGRLIHVVCKLCGIRAHSDEDVTVGTPLAFDIGGENLLTTPVIAITRG